MGEAAYENKRQEYLHQIACLTAEYEGFEGNDLPDSPFQDDEQVKRQFEVGRNYRDLYLAR